MTNSALSGFHDELTGGKKLCVMPVPRLILHSPLLDICGCNLYPDNSLDLTELRIVSHPEWEWSEIKRKGHGDLEWSKSAATQISYKDYSDIALIAFLITLDFQKLFNGTHKYHKALLRESSECAEQAMDLIRFNYCRLDLPETLPGRVGTFGTKSPYSSALYYNINDHESYIIGAEVVTHQLTTGLGLELDGGIFGKAIANGEAGNIATRGLSMLSTAMESNSMTSKFVQCLSILEFLAFPDKFKNMQKVKGQIAAHVANDRKQYFDILEEFKKLTGYKDPNNREIGLRTNIVHMGERFESLVPDKVDQDRIFHQLQHYIRKTIDDLLGMSHQKWESVMAFREKRRQDWI